MSKEVAGMTLYTVRELADILGVTTITIRRYIADGSLKARKIGRAYHISDEALREFMDTGGKANNDEERRPLKYHIAEALSDYVEKIKNKEVKNE